MENLYTIKTCKLFKGKLKNWYNFTKNVHTKTKKEKDEFYMRKNYIIVIGIILTILFGVLIGGIIANNGSQEPEQQALKQETENNKLSDEIQITTTGAKEEKTTPNTLLRFKTFYKKCEHTAIVNEEISEKFVNKTERELRESYKDWQIQKFSAKQVELYKEADGICNEHYIIKENNGYVAIYLLDSNEKEILQETTQIAVAYLPQTDQVQLKEGIKVVGRQKLNATLEDYE